MTLEQITALAKEAGLHSALILSIYGNTESLTSSETVELKRIHDFAKLIEAATREECAKKVEQDLYPDDAGKPYTQQYNYSIKVLADKVRRSA